MEDLGISIPKISAKQSVVKTVYIIDRMNILRLWNLKIYLMSVGDYSVVIYKLYISDNRSTKLQKKNANALHAENSYIYIYIERERERHCVDTKVL